MPRRTLVPLLGALVLLVGGCSGDSDPAPRADPTPSVVSTSPAVESTAPVVETPDAYIRAWIDAETQMQNSGVTAHYRAITEACASCQTLADQVERYYAAGGFIEFGGQSVTKLKRFAAGGNIAKWDVFLSTSPTSFKKSESAEVQNLRGGPVQYRATLKKKGTGWTLTDYLRVQS